MTRQQIREQLLIDLRAEGFSEWDTGELNQLINAAYFLTQKEVVKANANWHIAFTTTPTVANESWYPNPPTFGVKRIGLKSSSSDTRHTYLKKKNLEDVEGITSGEDNYYVREGTWIGIFPPPTSVISDGIQWQHCPIYSMDDDDEVPKLKTPLHIVICWWAKILALGDDHESTQVTQQKINHVLGDLASWYDVMMDSPEKFSIEV